MRKIICFLILACCLITSTSWAAVSYVSTSTWGESEGVVTTCSATLTVPSGHSNVAIFFLAYWLPETVPAVSTVVWDPTGANQSATSVSTKFTAADNRFQGQIFKLVNPTPGTSKTITLTMNNTVSRCAITAVVMDGVDQTTPVRAGSYTTSASNSVTVTSQTGDLTTSGGIGGAAGCGSGAITTNQTLAVSGCNGSPNFDATSGQDYATGAATVTHTWSGSSTTGGTAGFSVQAAGAPPPTGSIRHRRVQ